VALRLEELSKTIDQTLPEDATPEFVEDVCRRARQLHVVSVCVLPAHVRAAADELRGSDVKLCALVGFPSGRAEPSVKIAEGRQAITDGAVELEFVINVRALRGGDARLVRDELVSFVRTMRMRSTNGGRGAGLLKAVVGTAHLDDKLKKLAAKIVELAEADFAQTATGYGTAAATVHDVELLRDCLPETVGVKASGGIETLDDVLAMTNAGAGRIGSSSAIQILEAPDSLVTAS
jgi:deoxyribose-phosphate aldolase